MEVMLRENVIDMILNDQARYRENKVFSHKELIPMSSEELEAAYEFFYAPDKSIKII